MNRPALAVVGPTASGKSALALLLAERFCGEIVSCDSMQIYRGMDVGTAKPSAAERKRIPHHMIDVRDPDEPYSAADYGEEAARVANDILARRRLPIFCGGTGLYLSAALTGRHDPAIIRRICPVVTALVAVVLCDQLALRFGTDYLAQV